jgi:hypothetical protein
MMFTFATVEKANYYGIINKMCIHCIMAKYIISYSNFMSLFKTKFILIKSNNNPQHEALL